TLDGSMAQEVASAGHCRRFPPPLRERVRGDGNLFIPPAPLFCKELPVFEGFDKFDIQTSDPQVKIHGVIGGKGPPLLLLHGNPLTHVHWHIMAPRLAKDFTVVAPALRGYGNSVKPRGLPDHSNYTFRRMG